MNIEEIKYFCRQYLSITQSWEDRRIEIPQEEVGRLSESIGGIHLGFLGLEYNYNRNHRVHWMTPDSLELFKQNKEDPIKLKCLQHFGWINEKGVPTDIQYNLNSDGFRIDCEDYEEEGIVFYGCSNTFGMGVHNEDTFAQRVSKHFNLACYNFGVSGVGLDVAAIHALFLLRAKVKRPKAIVVMCPPPRRWSWFVDDRIMTISSQDFDETIGRKNSDSMEFQSVLNDMNNMVQMTKNLVSLQLVAEELNVPLILTSARYGDKLHHFPSWPMYKFYLDRGIDSFDGISMGRDLQHPGVETHKYWAEIIIKLIKEKL